MLPTHPNVSHNAYIVIYVIRKRGYNTMLLYKQLIQHLNQSAENVLVTVCTPLYKLNIKNNSFVY